MEIWATIADERRATADLLEPLTPEQWATPSLCGSWTVKDVAVHLVPQLGKGLGEFAAALVRKGGSFHKASESLVAKYSAATSTAEIVEGLRRDAGDRFVPPSMTPAAPLTEVLVHRLDIAVPLGLGLSVEADRPSSPWHTALDFLVTNKARRGFVKRGLPMVTYVATDVLVDDEQWRFGRGPEVRGPAAALGLAITGRGAWLDRLEGPGRESLATWVG
jgi:uncharacterized protein (TIGR03083 family)